MKLIHRLYIHHTLQGLGQGILLCMLTLFMVEKGLALWQVGVTFGAFSLTAVLFELPLGAAADLYGRIRVFRWSLMLNIAALIFAALLHGFYPTLAAMILLGLARALETGSVSAWEIEQFHIRKFAKSTSSLIAHLQAAGAIGIAAGALVGGYIPKSTLLLKATYIVPSSLNLLATAGIAIIHITILPWIFSEGDLRSKSNNKSTIQNQIHVAIQQGMFTPTLRNIFWVVFVTGMVLSTLEAYWQPFVKGLISNQSYEVFGWITTGYFISAALGPSLYSILIEKTTLKPNSSINLLLIITAPILFTLAASGRSWSFALGYFLFMGGFVCLNIPVQVIVNEHVGNEIRSTMQSVTSLVMQAGSSVAAFGFAPIVQIVGISSLWQSLAGVLLILLLVRFFLRPSSKQQSTPS